MRPQLVRRQYLVTRDNLAKIKLISKEQDCSATEVVRRAIDSYNPNDSEEIKLEELVDMMASNVREAIAEVRNARKSVSQVNEEYKKKVD